MNGCFLGIFRELAAIVNDERMQEDAGPILSEIQSVVRMVALEVLEIQGSATRAMLSVQHSSRDSVMSNSFNICFE